MYTLLWESLLGRYLPGLKVVSVRHFSESAFIRILDDPDYTLKSAASLNAAIFTVIGAVILGVALSTWRLKRMSLD
jgi:hypothetical protein